MYAWTLHIMYMHVICTHTHIYILICVCIYIVCIIYIYRERHLAVLWKCFFMFVIFKYSSVQFSSATQPCPTLCNPMNCDVPGLPVHHQLLEFTQTHVHQVGDAIQLSHLLSSPSPPAPNPSQQRGLFQWVNSSHEVAKVLEFQL